MRLCFAVFLAVLPACGASSPCAGESGVCVVLHVSGDGVSVIDQLSATNGAVTMTTPSTPKQQTLPIDVGVTFGPTLAVAANVEISGLLAGAVVGAGTVTVPATPAAGTKLDVILHAATSADLSAPTNGDLSPQQGDLSPPALLLSGQSCTDGSQCETTFCVDGVCCGDACTGSCKACNLPGALGTCTLAPSGTNVRSSCSDDGTPCGLDGTCDGTGSCRFKQTTVQCQPQKCQTGTLTKAATCDGHGACQTPGTRTCDPFVCNSTGDDCYNTCTAGSTECKPPNTCSSASCGPKPLGATCSAGTECGSTQCTDGVCCSSSSCTACNRCNVLGVEGTCKPIGDTLTDARCNGAPPSTTGCGNTGTCDASGACNKWPSGTVCAAGSCDNSGNPGMATPARTCNSAGICLSAGPAQSCGPYQCHANADGSTACYSGSCWSCGRKPPGSSCGGVTNSSICASGASCPVGVRIESACTNSCINMAILCE